MSRRFKRDAPVHRHLEVGVSEKQNRAFQLAAAQVGEDLTCFILTAVEDRIFSLASGLARGADLQSVFAVLDSVATTAQSNVDEVLRLRSALAGTVAVYPDEIVQTPPMNAEADAAKIAA